MIKIKITKNYCCMECGALICLLTALYGSGLCRSCANKGKRNPMFASKRLVGNNNPMYIDGRSCIEKHCVDCGKLVSNYHTKRCRKCYQKLLRKEHHPNWKGGKPKCIDCGKQLSFYSCKRCRKCYWKSRIKPKITYCCIDCGGKISYPTAIYGNGRCLKCKAQGNLHPLFGKKMKLLVKKKISNALIGRFTGKESPNYIHGKSNYPHPLEFSTLLKQKIRQRDNFICQCCGLKENKNLDKSKNKRHLSVHHIDYNKQNCKEDNLISLCDSCHSKSNRNRDYWYAYYTYLMENR